MVENSENRIRWAPKVSKARIRRLYLDYMHDVADIDQINEVGYALYARCQSIVEVTNARDGSVKCQDCGNVVSRSHGPEEVLPCGKCSWQMRWYDYRKRYSRRGLLAGTKGAVVIEVFRDFEKAWPHARAARDKMLLIDTLIHEFHKDAIGNPTRPAACNVIKGSAADVISLLKELAYGSEGDVKIREARRVWLKRLGKSGFGSRELEDDNC